MAVEIPTRQLAKVFSRRCSEGWTQSMELCFRGDWLLVRTTRTRLKERSSHNSNLDAFDDLQFDSLDSEPEAPPPKVLSPSLSRKLVDEPLWNAELVDTHLDLNTDEHRFAVKWHEWDAMEEPDTGNPDQVIRMPSNLKCLLQQLRFISRSFDGSAANSSLATQTAASLYKRLSKATCQLRLEDHDRLELEAWAHDTSRFHATFSGLRRHNIPSGQECGPLSTRCLVNMDSLMRTIQCLQALSDSVGLSGGQSLMACIQDVLLTIYVGGLPGRASMCFYIPAHVND